MSEIIDAVKDMLEVKCREDYKWAAIQIENLRIREYKLEAEQLQNRNDWLALMAERNELRSALRKISKGKVEFQGDEHNGFYALKDYAAEAVRAFDREFNRKAPLSHEDQTEE